MGRQMEGKKERMRKRVKKGERKEESTVVQAGLYQNWLKINQLYSPHT